MFLRDLLVKMSHVLPDKPYLYLKYWQRMHKWPNLKNPQTFSEKLNWLKLYDRNPLYTTLVDKYAVKQYIANKIGEQYVIPTLGVWNSFDEIDFGKLPEQFVLKTTHDSGGIVIVKDKKMLDKQAAKNKLTKSLRNNYYYHGREWPYKNVPHRIIAEQYLENASTQDLKDYKFFCFNGYVDNVMVCIDRAQGDTKFYFFNRDWKLLRLNERGKIAPADFTLEQPVSIGKMFELAETLSQNIPFSRVDLYSCNNQIYFGEMTFYPQSGFDKKLLPETDSYFGKLIHLPQ